MKWHIKAVPGTEDLTNWSWHAVSEDQNRVFTGSGLDSAQEALEAARGAATAHERRVQLIESHVVAEVFTPVLD